MGGRGASSGVSDKGKKYGTEYKTLLKVGNIKFVTKTSEDSEELFETMTKNRVYATVNARGVLKSVIYFDKDNKRNKVIDLEHKHKGMIPHAHHGYYHNENDNMKGATNIDDKERKMVERIKKIWYNNRNRS